MYLTLIQRLFLFLSCEKRFESFEYKRIDLDLHFLIFFSLDHLFVQNFPSTTNRCTFRCKKHREEENVRLHDLQQFTNEFIIDRVGEYLSLSDKRLGMQESEQSERGR